MRLLPLLALLPLLGGCVFPSGGIEPGDFLKGDTYKEWVLEIDSVSGYRPSTSLQSFLSGHLSPLVHKERGVRLLVDETLPASGKTWDDGDLRALSREHQKTKTEGDVVVTHLLFLDGQYSTSGVLGVAYNHDFVVIFAEQVQQACTLPFCTNPEAILRAVTLHEMGHILGLVDNGVGMVKPHEAGECNGRPDQGHSSSQESVMYCLVETQEVLAVLGAQPPQEFDADDRADLRAAGGR